MHSPLSLPCKAIIFLNSLFYLASGEAPQSIPITPPPVYYSPNPLSVFSSPICPATRFPYEASTTKSEHLPWDEEPDCLRIINLNGEHTYCIHASTSFANGRGISILTTPEIGSSIANSPAFSPSTLIPNKLTTSRFDPAASPSFPPPFEIKEIPGRGKGLVANKTINFGDIISYSTPLLIVDRDFFDSDVGLERIQRFFLLREAISKLPASSQALFFSQCTRESGIGLPTSETISEAEIEDIMKTNAYTGYFTPVSTTDKYGIETAADPVTHGLNIPESSRLNHDCRPNTHFAFDTETLMHKIHAVTTIQPGEEITTSYISDLDSFEARQTMLLKHWGFHCSCSLCSSPSSHRTQSDSRLSLIRKYRTYLMDWSYESLGTPELSLKYMSLLKEEKLHAKIGEAYTIAALRFNAWEQEAEAVKYAAMAVERGLWWDGAEELDLSQMRKLVAEGKRHWSWGLGRKLRIGQDGTAPVDANVAHAGMRLVKQEVIR